MSSNEHGDGARTIPMPPPLVYLGPLIAGVALRNALPGLPIPRLLRRFAGVLLIGSGSALCGWFVRTMLRTKTTLEPRGSVTALVTTGPFELSRNPGYLSMALISAGVALLSNAAPVLLLLPVVLTVITRGVIEPEERYLDQRFGDRYREYQARTPRWL